VHYLCTRFRRKVRLFDRLDGIVVEKKFDKRLVVHLDHLPLPSALKEKPSTTGLGPDSIQRSLT